MAAMAVIASGFYGRVAAEVADDVRRDDLYSYARESTDARESPEVDLRRLALTALRRPPPGRTTRWVRSGMTFPERRCDAMKKCGRIEEAAAQPTGWWRRDVGAAAIPVLEWIGEGVICERG
jgi:hypothetical protein